MASKTITCPSCGFKNSTAGRCVSCGAKMDALGSAARTREEEMERRYQQEGFSFVWFLVSLLVEAVLTAALVVGLPMVVSALDFEGITGMYVAVPVWFLGGLLVGMISPGKTFIEPVVASFVVAIPTVFYAVVTRTRDFTPVFMFIIMAAVGVMFTLIGSYLGERIQMGPPPKAID
ncbi:MAG TPA: hypothetical protein PLI95_05025 [Polyangiaceae bacterium]|nr:hypothetical protein [Polyangiaceae bacterium]